MSEQLSLNEWIFEFSMHMMFYTNLSFGECWMIGEIWIEEETWLEYSPHDAVCEELSAWND